MMTAAGTGATRASLRRPTGDGGPGVAGEPDEIKAPEGPRHRGILERPAGRSERRLREDLGEAQRSRETPRG